MSGTPLEVVEALFSKRMQELGLDADSYANYAACMVADEGLSVDERKSTMVEMLQLTVDDGRDLTEALADLLDAALILQSEEEAIARAQAEADARELAEWTAASRAPEVSPYSGVNKHTSDVGLDDGSLDAATRRAIAMQYGYIMEDEEEDAREASSGKPGKKRSKAQELAAAAAVRTGRLDSALGEMEDTHDSMPEAKGTYSMFVFISVRVTHPTSSTTLHAR